MGRSVSNFQKHGYSFGLEDMEPMAAMKVFCLRRSGDVAKEFQADLTFSELLARVYLQGVLDSGHAHCPRREEG